MTDHVIVAPFIESLYQALDAHRADRELTWAAALREINAPFEHSPSRPIAVSTVTGMRKRWAIEGDAVLQMLRWLGRSPESFVPDHNELPLETTALPTVPATRILRFDTRHLYAALNDRRLAFDLSWMDANEQIASGSPASLRHSRIDSPASLRHLASGGRTGFPHVLRYARWLGQPVAAFTRATRT